MIGKCNTGGGPEVTVDGVKVTKPTDFYYLKTDKYVELADLPGSFGKPGYSDPENGATVLDGYIYIIGGGYGGTSFYRWKGGEWETLPSFPAGYRIHASGLFNNEFHAICDYEDHYKWNGTEWIKLSTFPENMGEGFLLEYNGEMYCVGCWNDAFFYKWNGTSWTKLSANPPYKFSEYGVCVLYKGEIHLLGGMNNYTKHYKWNGSSWVSVSTIPYNSCGNAVVKDDEIHIFGGYQSDDSTKHYKWNGTEWTEVDTIPQKVDKSQVVNYNNEIHLLGCTAANTHVVWEKDLYMKN